MCRLLSIALISAALLLPGPVAAQLGQGFARPPGHGERSFQVGLKPREQAIEEALHRYGGEVLSVKLQRPVGEDPYYRIKLVQRGQVRVVRIDATAE